MAAEKKCLHFWGQIATKVAKHVAEPILAPESRFRGIRWGNVHHFRDLSVPTGPGVFSSRPLDLANRVQPNLPRGRRGPSKFSTPLPPREPSLANPFALLVQSPDPESKSPDVGKWTLASE